MVAILFAASWLQKDLPLELSLDDRSTERRQEMAEDLDRVAIMSAFLYIFVHRCCSWRKRDADVVGSEADDGRVDACS